MRTQAIGSDAGATQLFKVPAGVEALIGFSSIGTFNTLLGDTAEGKAFISNDITQTAGQMVNGIARGLIAVSNTTFPPIPVSAGETLMIGFIDTLSAVLYYSEPS